MSPDNDAIALRACYFLACDQAGIVWDQRDVILSGARGYRFSDLVTVRLDHDAAIVETVDENEATGANDDEVRNDPSEERRASVLQELAKERQLRRKKAPIGPGCRDACCAD